MKKYQENYSSQRVQMYDEISRKRKAINMTAILEDYLGKKAFKSAVVLDVGASTGIIDNELSKRVKRVIGMDIDQKAIYYAKSKFKRKNLKFIIGDALKIKQKNDKFDIVICTHVYEHVAEPQLLFDEIYRVLKPGGVCFLAAVNSLWPIEPHHNLPFLSYLPKNIANIYIRLKGKKEYYETPLNPWQLSKLLDKFVKTDYTQKIFVNPQKFRFEYKLLNRMPRILIYVLSVVSKYISPTTFWILEKT